MSFAFKLSHALSIFCNQNAVMRMPARVKHFSYNDSMQRKRKTTNKERKNNYSIKHFFQRYFYRFFSTKDFANLFTPVLPLGREPENLKSFVVIKLI